ncbi:MAG: hypothetical protein M1372_01805 [Patescibacteria group bacterium]|nr:hypothetical protein [Patescibacteria group bacterium]
MRSNAIKFKVLSAVFFIFLLSFLSVKPGFAIYDPLSRPNNFYGIHILFPDELDDAAKLVNSSGGDWGYVTIPIQAKDKDIDKWQKFMDDAKRLHLIPIIRLATQEDFIRKGVWRKPDFYDIIDFANFLNSLSWPTKNRYVVLFNEVNRSDEWGGETPDPSFYSQLVDFSYKTFKDRSDDFFIILGGLDNAAPNDGVNYIDEYTYLAQLIKYDPNVFNNIDGIASHSYPNPGFSQIPSANKKMGVSSYKFEYDFINSYTTSRKPIFITETGWSNGILPGSVIADYYKMTFEKIWGGDKDKVVAITPFLLRSNGGPFDIFSFYKNNELTPYYQTFQSMAKVKGDPILDTVKVLGTEVSSLKDDVRKFPNNAPEGIDAKFFVKLYFKTILGLN